MIANRRSRCQTSYVLYKIHLVWTRPPGSVLKIPVARQPVAILKPAADSPAFQPLYRQIKALITQSLVSGEWRPGEPIPSEIELASRFSVSQGTVRKAVGELADENVLVRQQGKGTFVASHAEERSQFPFLRITPDDGALEELDAQLIDLQRVRDPASARVLGLAAGQRHLRADAPPQSQRRAVCYEEVRLPARASRDSTRAVVEQHDACSTACTSRASACASCRPRSVKP